MNAYRLLTSVGFVTFLAVTEEDAAKKAKIYPQSDGPVIPFWRLH
jgi:hypothetical protein